LFQSDLAHSIEVAATRFDAAQQAFRVTTKRNAYPERTVSYFYVEALRQALGGAEVLLEVPIAGAASGRRDNHIDALVFNCDVAILCEFKRVWGPSHWQWLAEDVARIGPSVVADIASRFTSGPESAPRRLFAFFGADCWYEHIAGLWLTGTSDRRWLLPEVFREMTRGTHTVWRRPGEDFDGYYLTWALTPLASPENA